MVHRSKISGTVQQRVRERANYLCEYCHTSELWQYVSFTVDHIIPLALNGTDDINNLCLACFHCNRKKGIKIKGIDPFTDKEISLFHPRKHIWIGHFIWSSDRLEIVGLTAIGRTTIAALDLNRERVTRIRAADLDIGRHPPPGDPIQVREK